MTVCTTAGLRRSSISSHTLSSSLKTAHTDTSHFSHTLSWPRIRCKRTLLWRFSFRLHETVDCRLYISLSLFLNRSSCPVETRLAACTALKNFSPDAIYSRLVWYITCRLWIVSQTFPFRRAASSPASFSQLYPIGSIAGFHSALQLKIYVLGTRSASGAGLLLFFFNSWILSDSTSAPR